jgi:hypothetical protein
MHSDALAGRVALIYGSEGWGSSPSERASQAAGQAGACPGRMRAIPLTVRRRASMTRKSME